MLMEYVHGYVDDAESACAVIFLTWLLQRAACLSDLRCCEDSPRTYPLMMLRDLCPEELCNPVLPESQSKPGPSVTSQELHRQLESSAKQPFCLTFGVQGGAT